jgi:hypothetical protein
VSLSTTLHPNCSRRAGCRSAWLTPPSVCECVHDGVIVRQYSKALWSATGHKRALHKCSPFAIHFCVRRSSTVLPCGQGPGLYLALLRSDSSTNTPNAHYRCSFSAPIFVMCLRRTSNLVFRFRRNRMEFSEALHIVDCVFDSLTLYSVQSKKAFCKMTRP